MTAPIVNNQITPNPDFDMQITPNPDVGLEGNQSVQQKDSLPQNPELGKVSPKHERTVNFLSRVILACATMGISELCGIGSVLPVKASNPRINVDPKNQNIEMVDLSGKDDDDDNGVRYDNNIQNDSVNDILKEKKDAKKENMIKSNSVEQQSQKHVKKPESRKVPEMELADIETPGGGDDLNNEIIDNNQIIDDQEVVNEKSVKPEK